MVLLTIVTKSNPHTLYFDHPIEKPSYIRLLSASIYNSWNIEQICLILILQVKKQLSEALSKGIILLIK